MYYKIASILLNNEQKSGTASDIFIAQPDTAKEALVGKLFILAEIQAPGSDAAKILEFLIGNLNFNYYQNEKVILRERIETITLESVFESALAKTNKDLAEFLAQEKIKISPYALNIAICVLYKNEIYFTGVGKNKTLLIYKEKIALKQKGREISDLEKIEYKVSDVGETQEIEALNINKLFSNVVSGKIPVGGYFLVINEALSEYLSNKQLVRIVTKLSPTGAAEQIRNLLEQINSYVSFLGIIIKNTVATSLSDEDLKNRLEEEIKIDDYKPEITKIEEKTEAIMTPAGVVNLKKWSKNIGGKMKTAAPDKNQTTKKMFLLKEKIFFKRRSSFISSEKIRKILQKIGQLLNALSSFILKSFAKKEKTSPAAISEATPEIREGDDNPPFFSGKKIKIILAIALIFIIIFAVNIYLKGQKNQEAEKLRTFNSLISSIEKNQNKIEADFIYGNKSEIKELYDQDQALLAQIPTEEISKRGDIKALFDRQQQQLEKMQNINRISDLKKIADFSNLTAAADPQSLIISGQTVYAGDAKNNAIFKIDSKENIVTAVYNLGSSSSSLSTLAFPTVGQDNNLFYLNGSTLLLLNKADQPSSLKITLPSAPENVAGMKAFSDKLYIADKNLGQIFRYTKSPDGFINRQPAWPEAKVDLGSATDLFIDAEGYVYVLGRNGQVDKYLKGKKQDLTLSPIDPPLESASRLIVTANNFYILEPLKKRLVVFDAKGTFVAQYIFDGLNNVKDFEVNTVDKKIYVLAGSSVYEMDMK